MKTLSLFLLFPLFTLLNNVFNAESFLFRNTRSNNFLDTVTRSNNKRSLLLQAKRPIRRRNFPVSKNYYEQYIKRLNSKNITTQLDSIINEFEENEIINTEYDAENLLSEKENRTSLLDNLPKTGIRIYLDKGALFNSLGLTITGVNGEEMDPAGFGGSFPPQSERDFDDEDEGYYKKKDSKSENFEVLKKCPITFKDIGGYENVKQELNQCVDMLKNYKKYSKYNVRIPKGLILEGPPGTGKTLIAKGLAGESKCNFIPVSGADFQEKYVGIGSTRVKELFKLAKKNLPCIIFIDEIDALGRKRSSDGESSSSERDNTLNSLLVELDGFKNNTGVFVIGATNRIDLLDSALTRPGRFDKKVYIGIPDEVTRRAILNIHIRGKSYDNTTIDIENLVDTTQGFTGAQIENLLNEAMLNALRYDRTEFTADDFELVLNKMIVGWQPIEHKYNEDIIDRIAVHEMGHAITGVLSKNHSKVKKVVINLSSPKSPGYTIFEGNVNNLLTKESLFENLVVLLAGRVSEELIYGVSITTGAINDFEQSLELATKMVLYYGMGTSIIYSSMSDKYKQKVDEDVMSLINSAYFKAKMLLEEHKDVILVGAKLLKEKQLINAEELENLVYYKQNKESISLNEKLF
jgi:cell division protease FtsH